MKLLLDKGADPNKPFVGQLHSSSLCCGEFTNATPLYRAAIASDVEGLKMLIAKGGNPNWVPGEIKMEGRGGRGGNGNVMRPPIFPAMTGGRGAAFGGGPGFGREGPPPFREASNRKPIDAVRVLLEGGADPNSWGPDGNTPTHAAAAAGNIDMIKLLHEKGAKLDMANRDGKTALDIAEGPQPAGRGRGAMPMDMMNMDGMGRGDAPRRASRQEVAKLLRELLGWPANPANDRAPETEKPAEGAAQGGQQ
jgi:hypothetical protein